jgi:hypothetical protein
MPSEKIRSQKDIYTPSGMLIALQNKIKALYEMRMKDYNDYQNIENNLRSVEPSSEEAQNLETYKENLGNRIMSADEEIKYLKKRMKDQAQKHSLIDLEFYPKLNDSILLFKKQFLPKVPRKDIPKAIRAYVGADKEYKNKLITIYINHFFNDIKPFPGKWQKAVKEFVSHLQ